MLSNLNWLNKGQPFPPKCEEERLKRYRDNILTFNNKHTEVYEEQWRRVERVIGKYIDVVQYAVVLNYQKKISVKLGDFLFMEPPTITSKKNQDAVDKILKQSDINTIGYQSVIDFSRCGDTVLKINTDEKGKGYISCITPTRYFKVVQPNDIKKTQYHVIAWLYEEDDKTYLKSIIHEKGKYTERVNAMNGDFIGKLISEKEQNTGLDDFAIVTIHNLPTSDSVYGVDDYEDVDSIIAEIEIRTAQISKVLDVHSSPSMTGPRTAMQENADGSFSVYGGNWFPQDSKDDIPVSYLVWEASLDANFKQIEKLMQHLAVISEMGAAVLNDDFKGMGAISGSALKKLYINVLAKVSRAQKAFDKGYKKAIALASQAGYQSIDEGDIDIKWQDGLPDDPVEEANIMNIRSGGSQTASVVSLIQEYDGKSEKAARAEFEEIQKENGLDGEMSVDIDPEPPEIPDDAQGTTGTSR